MATKTKKKTAKKSAGKTLKTKLATKKIKRDTSAVASSKDKPVDKSAKSSDFWSVREMCAELNISIKTAYTWLNGGKLPTAKRCVEAKDGFSPGEWMIGKKGFKRPTGYARVSE